MAEEPAPPQIDCGIDGLANAAPRSEDEEESRPAAAAS
jgi:hypothetical protein